MSPLRLEAVYERIPQGWDRSAPSTVRWGFRASLGDDRDQLPQDAERAALSAPAVLVPATAASLRGPRVGPREAELVSPGPGLLAYTAAGGEIPLFDTAFPTGTGQILDLRA